MFHKSSSQCSTEGRWCLTDWPTDWQLPPPTADNSTHARHQLQLEPMGCGGTPSTLLPGPQIPVCPSFPLLRDQIPSQGLSGPAVHAPRMPPRRHTTLALSLLASLDYTLNHLDLRTGGTFGNRSLRFTEGVCFESTFQQVLCKVLSWTVACLFNFVCYWCRCCKCACTFLIY